MENKLNLITELAISTVVDFANKRGAWPVFLQTAARIYKYPFYDQLLIYAQRPDATACAPIEIWNTRMKRWVKRGAKGIALIDHTGGAQKLRYVFDVSDTYARRSDSVYPQMWAAKNEFKAGIIEDLAKSFGEVDSKARTFELELMSISANAVNDRYAYLRYDLVEALEGSLTNGDYKLLLEPIAYFHFTPNYGSNTTATWSQWKATWIPPTTPEDIGYWEFYSETYTVSLDVDFKLSPDSRVKTAEQRGRVFEMKSGYGINANSGTSVQTSGSPSFSTDYTQAQTEMATFSDFGFTTYNRLLEPESKGTSTSWHFKKNINSYYGCHVHFTPLWYPDNTDYVVGLSVYDAWTPVGMLYTTASDRVAINGNVYDDWYIRLTK